MRRWSDLLLNHQNLSPLILLASWKSFSIRVTRLAWMEHYWASSKIPTRQHSTASCRASRAWTETLIWSFLVLIVSRTSLQKGSFGMTSSVCFQSFLISLKATVPGLYLLLCLVPPVPLPQVTIPFPPVDEYCPDMIGLPTDCLPEGALSLLTDAA